MLISAIETVLSDSGISVPFSDIKDLVLARITTVPSGMGVNVSRSLGLRDIDRRMSAGIVICPLLVSVASDMLNPYVFNYCKDPGGREQETGLAVKKGP